MIPSLQKLKKDYENKDLSRQNVLDEYLLKECGETIKYTNEVKNGKSPNENFCITGYTKLYPKILFDGIGRTKRLAKDNICDGIMAQILNNDWVVYKDEEENIHSFKSNNENRDDNGLILNNQTRYWKSHSNYGPPISQKIPWGISLQTDSESIIYCWRCDKNYRVGTKECHYSKKCPNPIYDDPNWKEKLNTDSNSEKTTLNDNKKIKVENKQKPKKGSLHLYIQLNHSLSYLDRLIEKSKKNGYKTFVYEEDYHHLKEKFPDFFSCQSKEFFDESLDYYNILIFGSVISIANDKIKNLKEKYNIYLIKTKNDVTPELIVMSDYINGMKV